MTPDSPELLKSNDFLVFDEMEPGVYHNTDDIFSQTSKYIF